MQKFGNFLKIDNFGFIYFQISIMRFLNNNSLDPQ